MGTAPLILTLALDDASQQIFDALRKKYFPLERNFLRAHCTLFHALPREKETAIRIDLDNLTATLTAFPLTVEPPKSIGRGVVFPLSSDEAIRLHASLQKRWRMQLSPQDRQRLWPHVTVQNKVAPDVAKQTLHSLLNDYQSLTARGVGVQLWEYLGGPWRLLETFPFCASVLSSSQV